MNEQLEELAGRYVRDQLAAPERQAFEAQLSANSLLAAHVRKVEAALALRRCLLELHGAPNAARP